MDRVLLTVTEVAETLGCGRTLVYELIRRGDLTAVKLGRLTRVPVAAIDELIAKSRLEVDKVDRDSVGLDFVF